MAGDASKTERVREQAQTGVTHINDARTRRRAAFAERAAEELLRVSTLEEVLTRVVWLVVPDLADYCTLDLLERGELRRVAVAHVDMRDEQRLWDVCSPDGDAEAHERAARAALESGEPQTRRGSMCITRIAPDGKATPARSRETRVLSEMIYPLRVANRTHGVLSVGVGPFREVMPRDERALIEMLVRLGASAIDTALVRASRERAFEAAERGLSQMKRLSEVTAALSRAVSPNEVARRVVEDGARVLGARACVIARLSPCGAELEIVHAAGFPEVIPAHTPRISMATEAPVAEAVRIKQPIWLRSRADLAARYPGLPLGDLVQGSHAWAAVPLFVDGQVVGSLALSFQEPRAFDDNERWLVLSLAQHCADALDRASLSAGAAEEAVHLSHEILKQMPEAILVTDLYGTILRWMGKATQIFGFTETEAVGRPVTILAHPDTVERLGPRILRGIRDQGAFLGELVCVRKDGTTVPIETTAKPVFDKEGRARFLVGVCRDISERKRAEEERTRLIREQIARAEAEDAARRSSFLAEASALLSASLDYEATLEKIVRLVVPTMATYAMLDVASEDGTTVTVAVAHEDPALERDVQDLRGGSTPDGWSEGPVTRVLGTRTSEIYSDLGVSSLERIVGSPEQAARFAKLRARSAIVVPLTVGDTASATLSLFRVGDRYSTKDLPFAEELAHRAAMALENARLYQNAQEATRMRDEFLGTVSHELRTPLNAVLGWTRMLRTASLNGTSQERALATIERNAMLQARLVEDLLDASRIVMGKLRLELRTLDLVGPINAAIEAVRPAATAKSVCLENSLERGACLVEGDPSRVQQIVWNLLTNAIKFTPHGGRVELTLGRSGQHARITVRDTGEGIRPEFLPYVFDRFRQGDSTTTRKHGGLGLGLAIVRHLVELHGGGVRADSAGEGKGAIFSVLLPLSPNPDLLASLDRFTPQPAGLEELPSLEGLRLLLVDDEQDSREMLAAMLQQCGAVVRCVSSAAAALSALDEFRPDVLVSDIGMPGEDGYALIRQIRALKPARWGALPAVALTAYASAEDRVRVLAAGFQMHVPKPVDAAELAATVASLSPRTTSRESAPPPVST
ncbi:GAF domain-containing protein [Polyangium sp. 15x6]|uniref:hybrid sensor histidine kinase/response regulator n=1 Tax=Polyangium sp. 15x6 TaxID=3042687 RepID=UPI00249CE175|nr:GAF domain-containing protein [Polyangium sp. 15x6]MDI3283659.1 GAF domain-containing protein [Polyangium sp. 15x6]